MTTLDNGATWNDKSTVQLGGGGGIEVRCK